MMKKMLLVLVMVSLPIAAQASSKQDKKRAEIQEMRTEVLNQLYAEKPEAKAQVEGSEGLSLPFSGSEQANICELTCSFRGISSP